MSNNFDFACVVGEEDDHDNLARSVAIIKAKTVTVSAVSFMYMGIVWVVGLFWGISCKIIKPAIMLPRARRFRGFKIRGLFSLAMMVGLVRGKFIEAKKIRRRL